MFSLLVYLLIYKFIMKSTPMIQTTKQQEKNNNFAILKCLGPPRTHNALIPLHNIQTYIYILTCRYIHVYIIYSLCVCTFKLYYILCLRLPCDLRVYAANYLVPPVPYQRGKGRTNLLPGHGQGRITILSDTRSKMHRFVLARAF